MTDRETLNTDREIWRGPDEGCGDFYADSIHVTEQGGIGIDCGGHVIAMPVREWHALARAHLEAREGDVGEFVERLREDHNSIWQVLMDEAADALTVLQAELWAAQEDAKVSREFLEIDKKRIATKDEELSALKADK